MELWVIAEDSDIYNTVIMLEPELGPSLGEFQARSYRQWGKEHSSSIGLL